MSCWESLYRASSTPTAQSSWAPLSSQALSRDALQREVPNGPWTNENKSGGNLAFKLVTKCYISSVNILYSEVW